MVKRRRGRPPKSAEEQERLRDRVVEATAVVFGRRGYHGLTVEEILEQAGISRPTFYAHFKNVDEPLEPVLEQANAALIAMVRVAAAESMAPADTLRCTLDAYLAWGESLGPLLRPMYAELHDPLSPVSRHRKRALRTLRDFVSDATAASDRPRPKALVVDVLISSLEYLGYRYHLAPRSSPVTRSETQDAMTRLALATLGQPDDWRLAALFTEGFPAALAAEEGEGREPKSSEPARPRRSRLRRTA